MKRLLTLALTFVWCFALAASAQARSYTYTNLGELSSDWSEGTVPYAINNNGQVVGQSNGSAFVWENGQMTALTGGTGGGAVAYDVNDSGQIVGIDDGSRIVMWQGNQKVYISDSFYNLPRKAIRPVNINNNGAVTFRQILWEDGVYSSPSMASLGEFAGLNDRGQLIGNMDFAYQLTGNIVTMLTPSGIYGSVSQAINNAGTVVGKSWNSGTVDMEAVLWNGSIPQFLGTLGQDPDHSYGSVALAINSQGMIVGKTMSDMLMFSTASTAFLYDPTTGEMIDLNAVQLAGAAGMYLAGAIDINDKGQIIGVAFANNGDDWVKQAFLLTPTPIPGAVWLLGTGLLGLIGFARKRTH